MSRKSFLYNQINLSHGRGRRTRSAADEVGDFGLNNLGIEHAPPMITRGVCIDAAGLNGGAYLEAGRAVTRNDL